MMHIHVCFGVAVLQDDLVYDMRGKREEGGMLLSLAGGLFLERVGSLPRFHLTTFLFLPATY